MAQNQVPLIGQTLQDAHGDLHAACVMLQQANMSLADSMAAAAAAAAWSAHGYDQFVSARDMFIESNSKLFNELEALEQLAQLENLADGIAERKR